MQNVKIVRNIRSYNREVRLEFEDAMSELLRHEKFRRLAGFKQHFKCTRLKHSMDVGYFSFYIAKFLGLDYISAGKAALLHDLCFHEKSGLRHSLKMLRRHPKDALENALEICDLNDIERDAIARHMWFVTLCPPKYAEGYIVTFVDKYCALKEFAGSIVNRRYANKASRF